MHSKNYKGARDIQKKNERNKNYTSKQRNEIVSSAKNDNYNLNNIIWVTETSCQTATLKFYHGERDTFFYLYFWQIFGNEDLRNKIKMFNEFIYTYRSIESYSMYLRYRWCLPTSCTHYSHTF